MWPFRKRKTFDDIYGEMLDARWKAYTDYAASAVCRGCGKKASERTPGDVWWTEDWCGCKAGAGMPDTRPDFGF